MDQQVACITVGTSLVNVTPGGKLTQLLDGIAHVNQLALLSSAGLATLDADVNLLDLATELDFGSVDELADASVSQQEFVLAAARVLSANGESSAATILTSMATNLTGSFAVGDILNVNTGNGSGASMTVDAGSLLQSAIMVSNGTNFVNLNVSSPSSKLTNFAIKAHVVSAPKIACGPAGTAATSAQIDVKLTATIVGSGLTSQIGSASIDEPYGLTVTSAKGTGTIRTIVCSTNTMIVDATSTAATVKLDELKVKVLNLLGLITLATLDVKGTGDLGAATPTAFTFIYPGQWGAQSTSGTPSTLFSVLSLTGLSTFASIVSNLTGGIDSLVTDPLFSALNSLGVGVGTLTVQPVGKLSCDVPDLRQ
jgi:hypothetical protein